MRFRRSRSRLIATAVTTVVALVGGALTGSTANAAEPSQFTVVDGAIRTATGTPVPASGTHASLWGNTSYATTSVSGSGRVLIGAIGDNCQGWPTVRVTVDGVSVGQTTIVSATSYGTYPVGAAVGAGQHTVQVQLVNDFRTDACDRNVHIGYARMETVGVTDTKFSFAVLPDTQQEVLNSGDTRFRNRTNWLVQNRSALDLRYVTHSGDVVNWDTADHSQYVIARDAMRPIEAAGLPYSLAIGNHDTQATGVGGSARDPARTRELVRDTTVFNRYFTAGQYGAVRGQFEAGKLDNSYSTFEAGGVQWLVLTLELWPRVEAVNWARNVVAANPRHNVIVVTHDYIDGNGAIEQSASYGATSPQYLFDNLIKQYANIRFVFSGHVGVAANRVDTGVNGNKIYSFLQTFHSNTTNPVRLVEVDTAANSLRTWIYAPYTNQSFTEYDRSFTGLGVVR
ncbi:carbohydrate-binding domain-containing protein [Micromonospora sp. WMMD1155]|uniref:carbohydrate-binding domain-containing protein n=1 Tax=Micromonospora sp. WMMD1155 TaxID=3016094 RepID=UPI00249C65F3|nr:carbohydrate-binding domain-containing protein [Micromonospora sp. WMMD1155]WFE53497.1 carbohydrate-binding domain-containing protein [Micromonospora sp. WMMD1155]